ncbi:MAG: VWA domain-containing protein [Myxococcales bacterium]|nr:VWA domain-containing protein [Myxococcales bacterium]
MGLFSDRERSKALYRAATVLSLCANACGARSQLRVTEAGVEDARDPAPFDSGILRDTGVDRPDVPSDTRVCPELEGEDGLLHPVCSLPGCDGHPRCLPCLEQREEFALTAVPEPELWFAIDGSQSMDRFTVVDGNRAGTRWEALNVAATSSLSTMNSLAMGAILFPSVDPMSSELPMCAVVSQMQVAPRRGANREILDLLRRHAPQGATPTGRAMMVLESAALRVAPISKRHFVLATDGDPNCGLDIENVARVIERLRSEQEIDTFVLGIPGEAGDADIDVIQALNRLAVAGGRPRDARTRFYAANNRLQIGSALDAILTVASGCSITLRSAVADARSMTVRMDGALLTRDIDWTYDARIDRRAVFFRGAACDAIRAGRARSATVTVCGW